MRRLVGVLLLAFLWSVPSQACEDCDEYWDWQAANWCKYCEARACGFFNCWIQEVGAVGGPEDYCVGDDYGCFETGYACVQEPRDMRLTPRLDGTWRLAHVEVRQPRNVRSSTVTATPAVKKKV